MHSNIEICSTQGIETRNGAVAGIMENPANARDFNVMWYSLNDVSMKCAIVQSVTMRN